MFDLPYKANGLAAQCKYALEKVNGMDVVVFVQTEKSIPSITNSVEILAQAILDEHFQNAHPQTVNFYLHYPQKDALINWEHVRFSVEPVQGKFAKFFGVTPKKWCVHSPRFSDSLSKNIALELAQLVQR